MRTVRNRQRLILQEVFHPFSATSLRMISRIALDRFNGLSIRQPIALLGRACPGGASRGNLTRTGRDGKALTVPTILTYAENRWLKSYCCNFLHSMRILSISASRENAKTLFVAGVSAAPRGSSRTLAMVL